MAKILFRVACICLWCGIAGQPLLAFEYLGSARLFTNDALADRHDRWRSFSYQAGLLLAPQDAFSTLDMVEFRFGVEAVTPWNMNDPAPDDRPFAGILRFEVHGYFDANPFEMSAGVGLSGTGSQTGVDRLIKPLHADRQYLSDESRDDQIGDDLYAELDLEVARRFRPVSGVAVRPYFRLRAGLEDLYTVGADFLVGQAAATSMRVRDHVTGHLMPQTRSPDQGAAFSLGGDVSYVEDTALLPDARGLMVEDIRWRVRGGVLWRADRFQAFYGATWLSREFSAQPESQVIGSIHLNWVF